MLWRRLATRTPRLLGPALVACSAAAADPASVHFAIDAQQDVKPISRFVYGLDGALTGACANCTFTRIGGNWLTTYNWENNASNAGTDWYNQNDGLLSSSDTPGEAGRPGIAQAPSKNAAIVLTVPINGYVAADKGPGGDVDQTPDYLEVRFKQERPAKGARCCRGRPTQPGAISRSSGFPRWRRPSRRPAVDSSTCSTCTGIPRRLAVARASSAPTRRRPWWPPGSRRRARSGTRATPRRAGSPRRRRSARSA